MTRLHSLSQLIKILSMAIVLLLVFPTNSFAAIGAACDVSGECGAGENCDNEAGGSRTCRLPIGAACTSSAQCRLESPCTAGTCTPSSGAPPSAPVPAPSAGGSCPCTCTIQTGTGPQSVSISGGITGVGTPTGPATRAEAQTACQTACQAQAATRTGTLTTAALEGCPASLFGAGGAGTGASGTGDGSGSGDAGSIALYNPLDAEVGVAEFISRGLRGVIGFVGALALLMFVYGGVMWMTAGDSKRIDTAKEILKNSTIGLVLIFFSYSIVSVVFSLLGSS
ncbi:hypothetical protein IPH19_03495 [Candidatus Uhrbacteria bacterium]|nr:MAG: hypothetical protein IPH19_03495 [Candidatus Uhrbacteria bacterium]